MERSALVVVLTKLGFKIQRVLVVDPSEDLTQEVERLKAVLARYGFESELKKPKVGHE